MRPGELYRRLDRLQHDRWFKVVASGVIAALAAALLLYYVVTVTPPSVELAAEAAQMEEAAPAVSPEERSRLEETQRLINDVLSQRKSVGAVALGLLVGAGIAVLVVWLGVSLTYLALAVGAAALWFLLYGLALLGALLGFPSPATLFRPDGGLARLLGGVVVLSAAFAALMAGMRMVFAARTGPVFAVAQNVLAEAVRMKVSAVFIVLLILGLAALPSLLDPTTPLRYRVQSFMQYGIGGSFWVIAILTLLFSAATLSFEQRDRVIWQTMTKPVAAWQYLFGKWLGVMALSGVLLAVCGSAIFLFTEYLKGQPAMGEIAPYVAAGGPGLTEDRRILHFQVLQARRATEPPPAFFPDDERFLQGVAAFVEDQKKISPDFRGTPAEIEQVRSDLYKQLIQASRTIEPGNSRHFRFEGLAQARERRIPISLRYRIDSGSNSPDQIYTLTFIVGHEVYRRQAALGYPLVIDSIPPDVIDSEGGLDLTVVNGDAYVLPDPSGANPMSIGFPPGGLEVSYSVGGYEMNFLRVVALLWLKLAFLSMLAICASTFLSFPVACLVAFGTFFAAEGAGYLSDASEYYGSGDFVGARGVFEWVVYRVSDSVSGLFRTYADLRPTAKLVDGRLVSWGGVAGAAILLGAWCVTLYGIAVAIFRRRELAMYSGQ